MSLSLLLRSFFAMIFSAATATASAVDVTVSAAASLTNAFKDVGLAFESRHPGDKVLLNLGASGALLQQIAKGAPVDVFASADQETMNAAQGQGLVRGSERHDFARNSLVLVVPTEGQLPLAWLDDLTKPNVNRIALGNPASVPAGRYAKRALEGAGLWHIVEAKSVTAQSVRQVLDYVARGEVEAGFVYATDAAIMQEKVRVAFPVPLDIPIRYPIARIATSANAEAAKRFVDFVLSPTAQAILHSYGFLAP